MFWTFAAMARAELLYVAAVYFLWLLLWPGARHLWELRGEVLAPVEAGPVLAFVAAVNELGVAGETGVVVADAVAVPE